MNTLKRISLSLTAHINSVIDQIENHEAVAGAVIEDVRQSLLKLRFQIKRIQSEQRSFERQLKNLSVDENTWRERALRLDQKDHAKALECVRRLKVCTQQKSALDAQIKEHQVLEQQLNEQLRRLELKFNELKQKQSVLAGRESRAEAISQMSRYQNPVDAASIFERWEHQIMKSEAGAEFEDELTDSLASSLEKEEELEVLETTLANLRGES